MGGVAGKVFRVVCVLSLLWGCAAGRCGRAQTAGPSVRVASAIAYDSAGNLYLADAASHQVFEATLGGKLVVFAGTGVQGFSGDGGPASAAQLNGPQGVAAAPDGTVYLADTGNNRVRAVDPQGRIRTVAGTGTAGFGGESGPAIAAALRHPTALAVDATGALLVCDTGNQRVRRLAGGVLTSMAGSGIEGYAGDGGPATAAALDMPEGITVDAAGDVFIADTHNERVRVVSPAGLISTVAGTGQRGFGGDGGSARLAMLSGPRGLAIGAGGELLIADAGNQRARAVSGQGVISSVMGTGVEGGSQDGVAALGAALRAPRGVALSSLGMPVVADALNGAARVLTGVPGLFVPAALAPNRRPSSVQAASATSMTYGQGSLSAMVSGAVGVPQGSVAFSEAGVALGAATLANAATAVSLPGLSAGSHTVLAQYGGDGLNPAALGQATARVTPAPVTAVANPITIAYGTATPAFSGGLLGVLPADRDEVVPVWDAGAAGLLGVGTYPMAVKLTGAKSGNYVLSASSQTGTVSVVRAASVTGVNAPSQAFAGMPFPVSVTVSAAGKGQPTGTVQFLEAGTVVATVPVQNGSASTVYPASGAGTRQLAAVFSGDGNFLPSSAATVSLTVLALPDFSLALTGAGTASVPAGATAKYTLSVSSNPGPFTGAVSLSAAGLPAGAVVSFSPPQVVPGTQVAAVTVAVQTMATTAIASEQPRTAARVLFAVLGLVWVFPKRHRGLLPRFRAVFLGVFLIGGLSGCGARSVSEGGDGPVAKTYAVQITGTATNLAGAVVSHSLPLTLTVEQ